MKLKIYQVDAFADAVFKGNPAAICPLETWLDDRTLQQIAMENNLPETAFYLKKGDGYEIRWFTPTVEVDLCGHATLASAYILFNKGGHAGAQIDFHSPRSGLLSVTRQDDLITLNFPADDLRPVELTEAMCAPFEVRPLEAYRGKTDIMLVFDSEDAIRDMQPRLNNIAGLPARGLIVTAKGEKVDFVSRFFAPQSGIPEDPVTGSAHTTLIPYWAGKLGKEGLTAVQLSARTGFLQCRHLGARVEIGGYAKLYLEGEIFL